MKLIDADALDECKELMTDINGNAVYAVKMSDIRCLLSALEQQPCDDTISREMALKECYDIAVDGERYRVIQEETLLGLPSVAVRQTEITLESAIDYLHKIGWIQEHDRILIERQKGGKE